jgi:hypothetical protein
VAPECCEVSRIAGAHLELPWLKALPASQTERGRVGPVHGRHPFLSAPPSRSWRLIDSSCSRAARACRSASCRSRSACRSAFSSAVFGRGRRGSSASGAAAARGVAGRRARDGAAVADQVWPRTIQTGEAVACPGGITSSQVSRRSFTNWSTFNAALPRSPMCMPPSMPKHLDQTLAVPAIKLSHR